MMKTLMQVNLLLFAISVLFIEVGPKLGTVSFDNVESSQLTRQNMGISLASIS